MRVNGASDEKRVRSLLTGHGPVLTGDKGGVWAPPYGVKPGQSGNPT